MPRFSVKMVLIVFVVVALWLSSFTRYVGADDVRRSILMLSLCASIALGVWSSGRRQAFWLGFLVVMGMYFYNNVGRFIPQFDWVYGIVTTVETTPPEGDLFTPPGDPFFGPPITPPIMAIETAQTVGMLLLAVVGGWVSAYVYERNRPAETN